MTKNIIKFSASLLATLIIVMMVYGTVRYLTLNSSMEVYLDEVELPYSDDGMLMCVNLRTYFLSNAEVGGVWTIVTIPAGSTLTDVDLSGDNPCIEFNDFGCGDYVLKYSVADDLCTNCFSTTDITFYKCCITGSATCS